MINRKINSHSCDKDTYNNHNKNLSKVKKDFKKRIYVSPKMKNKKEEILFVPNNKDNEEERQPTKNYKSETQDIFIKEHKKSNNDIESKFTIKSPEKRNLFLSRLRKKNNVNNVVNKEKNEITKQNKFDFIDKEKNIATLNFGNNRKYYENQYNSLIKENEKNDYNEDGNKKLNDYKNEGLYCHSLMDFRHSNYFKNRRDREKYKKIYISKRFNNFDDIIDKKQKEVKIYSNNNNQYLSKKDYINELFLKQKEENKKLNEDEESSQSYQQINDNYIEQGQNEIRKVDITGYRYKVKNRPNQLELKDEILSKINNIKNQLLITANYKDNDKENDDDIMRRKVEINTTIESNYEPKSIKNYMNKTYDYRIDSEDKLNYFDSEIKSNISSVGKIINKNSKNKRYNSPENSINNQYNLKSPNSSYKYDINKNKRYYTEENKNYNINQSYGTYDQNYNINTGKENQQIPLKKDNEANLIDYKYSYYLNKKNRKLKKLNNIYNQKKFCDINSLINDLTKIKNSRKKRFHRDINQKEEEI